MAYTKLFASIVTSTIWTEDDQTRIVWITMLASANKNGEVHASIPGLARISGVSVEACEKAIGKFLSPDPYSRTKDDEGRRIEAIDGGWALINHAKYRMLASKDETIMANAERQKRHRERQKRNAAVTDSNAAVTHGRDIADADADADAEEETSIPTPNVAALCLEGEEVKKPKPKREPMKATKEEVEAFTLTIGLTTKDGEFMFYNFEEKGWGKNWKMAVQKWKAAGWMPSQKEASRLQQPLPSAGTPKKTYSAADHMRAMGIEE